MTVNETARALARADQTIRRIPEPQSARWTFEVLREGVVVGTTIFCGGRLYHVAENIVGGFSAFTRLVAAETRQRGQGSVYAQTSETPDGVFATFLVRWRTTAGHRFSVELSQIASDPPKAARTWNAEGIICG